MKQLIIAGNTPYAAKATVPNANDLTKLGKGILGIFKLSNYALAEKTAKIAENFMVALGRGDNNQPLVFTEVDAKTLTVTKATKQDGKAFIGTVTISSVTIGEDYTIIVAKKGVKFHERNTWTATVAAKTTSAEAIAKALVEQFNGSSETSGVTASYNEGTITITGNVVGEDYSITCADALTGIQPVITQPAVPAILDKAYVKDLASRCAAGKGFNYTAEDAHEMYPGYPEEVSADSYVMYTLRFAVPRVSAKQRDEVVYQTLHICVPTGAASIADLDGIFGVAQSA